MKSGAQQDSDRENKTRQSCFKKEHTYKGSRRGTVNKEKPGRKCFPPDYSAVTVTGFLFPEADAIRELMLEWIGFRDSFFAYLCLACSVSFLISLICYSISRGLVLAFRAIKLI